MKNRKVLFELNKVCEQRGIIPRVQVEYARSEIRALNSLYPITKASEEVRRPQYRTLESYLSTSGLSPKGN